MAVLIVGGMSWQRVLAYNALAFALQFPLGVALDARPRWVKGAFVASLALTLAAVGTVVAWWLWRSFGNRDGVRMVGLALRASRNPDKTQIAFENDCGAERSPRPTVAWCLLVVAALFALVAWR